MQSTSLGKRQQLAQAFVLVPRAKSSHRRTCLLLHTVRVACIVKCQEVCFHTDAQRISLRVISKVLDIRLVSFRVIRALLQQPEQSAAQRAILSQISASAVVLLQLGPFSSQCDQTAPKGLKRNEKQPSSCSGSQRHNQRRGGTTHRECNRGLSASPHLLLGSYSPRTPRDTPSAPCA